MFYTIRWNWCYMMKKLTDILKTHKHMIAIKAFSRRFITKKFQKRACNLYILILKFNKSGEKWYEVVKNEMR